MNTNKGFAPIIAIIIAVVIIAGGIGGYLYVKNKNKSFGSVRTMACYDSPNNVSGKHGLPISCSKNSDCDLSDKNVITRMKDFCSPAEVGFYLCGFKDFCGDDGYCKHDCSIDAETKQVYNNCAKESETIGAQGMPTVCCSGLKDVGGWPGGYKGDCSLLPPPTGLSICTNCGNGICNINTGENKCNCPEDCK